MAVGACGVNGYHRSTHTAAPQLIPNSIACRLYLITILVETTIDLAIESDLLVRFHEVDKGKDNVSKKMPVYLTIFALAQCVLIVACLLDPDVFFSVFQFALAVDAVAARNTLQFIFLA